MTQGATVDPDIYIALLEDWPLRIGEFVCAFSACEYWTYVFLEGLGGKKARADAAFQLDRRVDQVKHLAKQRALPDELRKELVTALAELKTLSRCRNLASHNAPMAHVFVNELSGETELRFELRAANAIEKSATRENLRSWFTRAMSLERQLALLAGKTSLVFRERGKR